MKKPYKKMANPSEKNKAPKPRNVSRTRKVKAGKSMY